MAKAFENVKVQWNITLLQKGSTNKSIWGKYSSFSLKSSVAGSVPDNVEYVAWLFTSQVEFDTTLWVAVSVHTHMLDFTLRYGSISAPPTVSTTIGSCCVTRWTSFVLTCWLSHPVMEWQTTESLALTSTSFWTRTCPDAGSFEEKE